VIARPLGRTGLTVSALSLGTAALGRAYGIAAPGAPLHRDEHDATALIRAAIDRGITLVDTAPAYGDAERIVGAAVERRPDVLVATKISSDCRSAAAVLASVESSRRALRRDVIDVLQIHNATRPLIDESQITDGLVDAKARGLVRVLGVTVYDEEAALAAIRSGAFGVVQVAFNVLDQRMIRSVIPTAGASGVGIVVRSAFLKGALTRRARWLPEPLAPLRAAATRVRDEIAQGSWDALPSIAIRFCLSTAHVSSVLAGVTTVGELEAAVAAEAAGPLDPRSMAQAAALAIGEDELLNPSRWPAVP
jgi:aryl-alcohol dehydrogenase-like predicted oxidoreductase